MTLSEQFWDRAYDELKRSEPQLLEAYERILSQKLKEDSLTPEDSKVENSIEQANTTTRCSQMKQLVQAALKKTEREATIKQAGSEVLHSALAMKDIVSLAVRAAPQAALAWAGVCVALQVVNPFLT